MINNSRELEIKTLQDIYIDLRHSVSEFEFIFPETEGDNEEILKMKFGDFLSDINRLYWYNMIMTIARLLDPSVQNKEQKNERHNLTMEVLKDILQENSDDAFNDIENQIKRLRSDFLEVTKYRNKHLAHFDRDYTIGKERFGSTTTIKHVKEFCEVFGLMIHKTKVALGLGDFSGLVMRDARYSGSERVIEALNNQR